LRIGDFLLIFAQPTRVPAFDHAIWKLVMHGTE
jgi:hypothetical protein